MMIIGVNMERKIKMYKFFSIIMVLFLIACFFYLNSKSTYTLYESNIDGNYSVPTSKIHITLNDVDVFANASPLDSSVFDNHIIWDDYHVREGKVAPGAAGLVTLDLNPAGSEVALLFEFEFITDNLPQGMHMEYSDIQANHMFIRTGENTYSGIITLPQIEIGTTVNISFWFTFDYDDDVEVTSFVPEQIPGLFEINFHAYQYQGETIVPYSG